MNSVSAILLLGLLSFGAIISSSAKPAFAHTFSGDESATFLAKVEGLKVEINQIGKNISNSSLVKWHVDKIGEFWNANDTKEVAERNQRVANDVTTGLDKLFSEVNKTNPDPAVVNQTASGLQDTLGEVVSVRIDSSALQNATVNALALRSVLDETLEDYGIATGVSEEEEEEGGNSTSAANQAAEATTGPAKIVNMAAYQTAQGLAASATGMFDKLKTMSSSNATSAIGEIDKGLKDLQKAIADKAPLDDAKKIVDGTIDPNLQAAYRLQVVPEFPVPLLMSVGAIAAVVVITRYYRHFRRAS
jgi:hypothetical protein